MYEDLFKRYREQDARQVFAHLGYRGDQGLSLIHI